MIKIGSRKINILDSCILTTFVNLGRFEYDVDLDNQTINIHKTKGPFLRLFDDYYGVIEECAQNIISSYRYHTNNDTKITVSKNNNYPYSNNARTKTIYASFLDEIHFVGLMYIEKIEIKTNDEMKANYSTTKTSLVDDDTREEFNREDSNPFGIFRRNYQDDYGLMPDDWWIGTRNDDEYHPVQTTKSEPSIVDLLGCFVKSEHAIYICDKNIKKVGEKISKEKWFENERATFTKLIILHEIGHSVFQYIGYINKQPIKNETRANYFSSLMTFGEFDNYIKLFTRYQPYEYHFPFLSFSYMIVDRMNIIHGKYRSLNRYLDMLNDYNLVLLGDIYGISI